MSRTVILLVTNSEHANPGAVGKALERQGHHARKCCPMLGDSLPRIAGGRADGVSAVVVFGGPQCVTEIDQYPYLRDEITWLGALVRAGVPVLGICLGAQLIASALGARVGPHPEGLREIGYHPIDPTERGRGLLEDGFHAYQWHREGFELPEGAELLATGRMFRNQAFRLGATVYGLQFHPEMTRTIMERWITSEKGAPQLDLPEVQPAHVQRAAADDHLPRVHAWLERFLGLWLGTCSGRNAA